MSVATNPADETAALGLDSERRQRQALQAECDALRADAATLQQQCDELRQILDAVLAVDDAQLWEWSRDTDVLLMYQPEGTDAPAMPGTERFTSVVDDAHREDQAALRQSWRAVQSGASAHLDISFRRATAMQWRWFRLRGQVLARDADGQATRLIGTLQDISDSKHADDARQRRAQAFAIARDPMLLVDAQGTIIDSNYALQTLLGLAEAEIAGRSITAFFADVGSGIAALQRLQDWRGELLLRGAHGSARTVDLSIIACTGRYAGSGVHLVCARDITEQKSSAHALDKLVRFDSLTGLPNRLSFQAALEARLNATEACFALLFINLDGFKHINDALGHEFGDALLAEVGRRLTISAGGEAYVARWGGDEFVVLLPHRDPRVEAARVADRIIQVLKRESTVGQHRLSASASIGIALAPDDGRSATLLVRRADTAMYAAKRGGRCRWEFFRNEFDDDSLRRLTLVNLLRQDAERGRFHFVAQPKVDGQGLVVGFELLIRWRTDEFGAVSPAYFIPLAEEIGVIGQLGREAMLAATRLIRGLIDHDCGVPVAVNLSSKQLIDPVLEQALVEACMIEGIGPHLLEVEVTESALLDNLETAKAKLGALRSRGFKVSLDDFGTGFSSLSYLRDLPFDKLKIDKSFVTSLKEGARSIALTRGIVNLSRSLGMRSVAEGVETRAEYETLQSMGVDEYQGYLFARPLPLDDAIAYAVSHH